MSERPRVEPTPERQIDWRSGNGQKLMSRLLGSAGVPKLYQKAEWEKCRAEAPLREYARQMRRNVAQGRGLLILGPVGTGKSSAAGLVCRHAVTLDLSLLWVYVPDMLALLREPKEFRDLVARSKRADVLVWDDFGVTGVADWQIGSLDRIVEHRYREMKPMIVTTNLAREDLETEALERLNDRWSERRFVVTISGDSMRKDWRNEET